jgi:ATP-dependent exoDNAse (exonuclease V) beta subunit
MTIHKAKGLESPVAIVLSESLRASSILSTRSGQVSLLRIQPADRKRPFFKKYEEERLKDQ